MYGVQQAGNQAAGPLQEEGLSLSQSLTATEAGKGVALRSKRLLSNIAPLFLGHSRHAFLPSKAGRGADSWPVNVLGDILRQKDA